ncbi:MAG: hypothetical protein WBK77_05420 [Alphaproteobacteria bacterium]
MKNITLSLLATTILSTAAVQANAAVKEPEIHFHPAKPWSVGHKDTPTDCTVKSEFNNGFVLQLDGSSKWVETFSIDFRQGIFTPGQDYNISLNVPGKANRSLAAKASNPSTLTIPMGAQKDIYQAMRDSAVVDVAIDQNSFRFYLINFTAAAGDFEKCMAGGVVPAAAPSDMAPAQPKKLQEAAVGKNVASQGDLAPPPPNAAPEVIATINESVAMEQKEASGQTAAIVEILPEDPKPVVKQIPYTETVNPGNQQAAPKTAAAPGQNYHKRMSEELAEEMSRNPSIASVEGKAAAPAAIAAGTEAVAEEKLAPIPSEVQAMAAQKPQAGDDEPFSKRGEIIKTDVAPSKTMKNPEITASPVPAPVQQASTKNMKSPESVVHRETYKGDVDLTNLDKVEPSAAGGAGEPFAQFAKNDPAVRGDLRADPEMLHKISELEAKVAKLQKENASMNQELQGTLQGAQEERVSIASENWNLERATMRYNEAERQLKRLGDQVQRERAACNAEKKDIEAQLFDPKITDQQQLARLAELERKLADAEQKLQDQQMQFQERARILQSQKATQ